MKQKLLLGSVSLSLMLAGCASPAATEQAQATATATASAAATPPVSATVTTPGQPETGGLRFTVDGQTATFDELSAAHKLVTDDYKNGVDVMRGYLEVEMESMIEYFPTADDVRHNLGYPDGSALSKDDYLKAAALYRKTYDIVYVAPAEGTNTIYTVMGKIANTAISKRYDANGGDPTKESVPFNAEIVAHGEMTSFSYSDTYNTTPDVYLMRGKDPEVTIEKVPAYKIDEGIRLRAGN